MPEPTVFDHYEVLRREDGSLFELGRGAMGITYKAFDTNLRCPVALKVINAASIHSEVARQRFVREARSAALLRHRHVASVFHLGVSGDTYFYAMEFIEGETVESLVHRRGPLQPVLAFRIAVQVARALGAAQRQQLVHRDIKPSNLMLVREDDELLVKVIDFGLAKSSDTADGSTANDATLNAPGFVGTPHFASPEQLDELDLDARSDIYSLGVTLWYMLTGEPPFTGTLAQVMSQHLTSPPPADRLPAMPPQVRELILRMLSKDPSKRPQTPPDLRTDLETAIELIISAAPPASDPAAEIVLVPEAGLSGGAILKNKGFYAGAIVATRYELLRDLGENNSGWAFQAEDLHDGSRVRLLVLQSDWASDPAALTQIEREAEKIRAIEHPNLLRVLGLERTTEAGFILMEWTDGFSLLDLLRCRQELDADEALLLLRQLAAGVDEAAAHAARHLDFSLNQILVHFPALEQEAERRLAIPVDRWPEFLVKLNALGITREFAASDTWAGGQTIVGGMPAASRDPNSAPVPHYVQSLAAVIYELLGGALSPAAVSGLGTQPIGRYVPVAALPETGNEVIKKALDPNTVYATAADFCRDMETALSGDFRAQLHTPTVSPIAAPPAAQSPSASPSRFDKKYATAAPTTRPRVPWLALVAIFVIAAAILALWLIFRPTPPEDIAAAPTAESTPEAAPSATPEATPTPATPTPAPSAASTTPTPAPPTPTPDPDAPLKAKLTQAQAFETAKDWPHAIEAYLDFTRSFPQVETGRIRLETLLASIRPTLDAMSPDQFTAISPAITDAARQESVPAMVILANHLRDASPGDAFAWYCAAAARGNASAITQAGLMISNGSGVLKDYTQAANWFQWASNAGDPAGKTCLAECYLYGTGVKKDEPHAVSILQDAVSAGDIRAMNLLGTCYHRGNGTDKNYPQALALFTRARDLGFEDASGNLGVLYMNGDGVTRDPQKAVNLFDEGARTGNPYCEYLLARCLESGIGVNASQFQAETWYRKAAQGGNPMAAQWCDQHKIPLPRPSP